MTLSASSWSPVPFETAKGCIDFLHGQMQRKKDLMFASHGGEGTGKSTTTENVMRALAHKMGVDYRERRVRIWDLDQLLDVLHEGRMFMLYELDEAVNIFHNQDWSKWEMKDLTKVIRQMRIMRSIWGLNIPDFEGLHPYLRHARIPLRFYHPPQWEPDGLGNGPAKMLFKQERFGYISNQVEYRWSDVGDFNPYCLDDDPDWSAYEDEKIKNFKRLVKGIKDRRKEETDKKKAAKMRKAKRQKKQAAKQEQEGQDRPRKATNRPAPPTATQ